MILYGEVTDSSYNEFTYFYWQNAAALIGEIELWGLWDVLIGRLRRLETSDLSCSLNYSQLDLMQKRKKEVKLVN
jgi:hypothetical protein